MSRERQICQAGKATSFRQAGSIAISALPGGARRSVKYRGAFSSFWVFLPFWELCRCPGFAYRLHYNIKRIKSKGEIETG